MPGRWTPRTSTNTLVSRFSIPDAPGGGGLDATLNVYVDGLFRKAIDLTSTYAWLYGAEASPGDSPGAGAPRHIYDEAHIMLGGTVPAGSTIRLQKDAADTSSYAIDFINLEQVAPVANPAPASYTVPAAFTHQDVQNAPDRVRMDTTGNRVSNNEARATGDDSFALFSAIDAGSAAVVRAGRHLDIRRPQER